MKKANPIVLAGKISIEARKRMFFSRVSMRRWNQCWEWTGKKTSNDYGIVMVNWKCVGAHRLSYVLANGPIPDGLFVIHQCDNPPCVNPRHLILGTPADNMRDRSKRGRWSGGEFHGEDHGMAKLTEFKVRAIRESNLPTGEISKRFKISKSQVRRIKKHQQWRHL